jgi:hypothetical protein
VNWLNTFIVSSRSNPVCWTFSSTVACWQWRATWSRQVEKGLGRELQSRHAYLIYRMVHRRAGVDELRQHRFGLGRIVGVGAMRATHIRSPLCGLARLPRCAAWLLSFQEEAGAMNENKQSSKTAVIYARSAVHNPQMIEGFLTALASPAFSRTHRRYRRAGKSC